MKKLIVILLLLKVTLSGHAQVSMSLHAGILGPRVHYVSDIPPLYSNDKKLNFSPMFNLRLSIKKFIATVGVGYTRHQFSLKPEYYWYQNFDSFFGPLSYKKNTAYAELHFILGRSFHLKNQKFLFNLQAGAFLLKQTEGRTNFYGPFPYQQQIGGTPAQRLFNPNIPGLMAELECSYRLKSRWSLYASLSWRGLLNYVTVDELGGPKDDIPIPRLKRNYINLGLGIGYTFIKSKAK